MPGIAQFVDECIVDMAQRRTASALLKICSAVDATSKKYCGVQESSARSFKTFVRDYRWLVQAMLGGGICLERTRFPNVAIVRGGERMERPDFADVIYHVHRCELVHNCRVPAGFNLIPSDNDRATFMIADDVLQLPDCLVWALSALCVFAECNRDERSDGDTFVSWRSPGQIPQQFIFPVSDNWGAEQQIRELIERFPKPIAIEIRW